METLCQMFLFLFLEKKQLNKAADFLTFLFFRMYWKSFRGLKTKFSITYISWCPYQHFGKDGKKHSYFLPMKYRSSSPEVSLRKDHLKICSKFTRKHPWRSVFSIKVACNFIETALRHGFSWVATWGLQLYYKRDSVWHRRFPVNFAKFLRTALFIEHFRWLLLKALRDIKEIRWIAWNNWKKKQKISLNTFLKPHTLSRKHRNPSGLCNIQFVKNFLSGHKSWNETHSIL